MLEELSTAQKVVGVKQSLRALREGRARKVFLACDADPTVTGRVEDACASVPDKYGFFGIFYRYPVKNKLSLRLAIFQKGELLNAYF